MRVLYISFYEFFFIRILRVENTQNECEILLGDTAAFNREYGCEPVKMEIVHFLV